MVQHANALGYLGQSAVCTHGCTTTSLVMLYLHVMKVEGKNLVILPKYDPGHFRL